MSSQGTRGPQAQGCGHELGVVLRRPDGCFLRKLVVVRREGPTLSFWTEEIGEAAIIERGQARGLAEVLLPDGGWFLVAVAQRSAT